MIICFLCFSYAFAQRSKMSPFVRQAAIAGAAKGTVSMSKGNGDHEAPYLIALVQTTDENTLRKHGCGILARWDDIYIASIPLTEIDVLAAERQVSRIEAGRCCSLANDTTATITHVRDLWKTPSPLTPQPTTFLTGKGIVVGLMDVGYDLTNPTYYSSDGTTYRVKRLWDILDHTKGGVPVRVDTIPGGYILGRQYIGYDSLMRKAHTTDGLIQFHGSHTSCTAAGSGAPFLCKEGETVYSGMAPDADICLVSNFVGDDESLISKEEEYKYTMATDLLGFKYIFDYADSVGKPCVISFSEGCYEDLYQSGIYNKVISKMVGPGHILVASAGNEASNGTYMHKEKGDSLKGAFLMASSSTGQYVLRSPIPPIVTLRFYDGSTGKIATEWKYDTEALRCYPDSLYADSVIVNNHKTCIYLQTYPSCYNDSLLATDLLIKDRQNSNIGYSPISLVLTDADNDVEAFANGGYFTTSSSDTSLKDYTNEHGVLFPGCLDDVICVGNVGRREFYFNVNGQKLYTGYSGGRIQVDSSHGPSMKGNLKPDVVAPGTSVISSYSSYYNGKYASYWRYYYTRITDYNGRKYPYLAMTGTSMSTPVVAGIVALWLQACPTLTPDDIRDVIAHTSTHYDESLSWPNNTYGYGEIDAKAGLEYIHKKFFEASDVNKDATTDVVDVNAVISSICGDGTYSSYADVNGDGYVDVRDVNAVIKVICGGEE